MSTPQNTSSAALSTPIKLTSPKEARLFSDMRLMPGQAIQLQAALTSGADRHMVNFIGYMNNVSFLVTPLFSKGKRVELLENEKFIARILTNQKVFGFSCFFLKKYDQPSPYLHMSLPKEIQTTLLRQSPRLKTDFFGTTKKSMDAAESQPVQIVNLSVDGAQIKVAEPVNDIGESIFLQFQLRLNDKEFNFEMYATIRTTTHELKNCHSNGVTHGLQFVNLEETSYFNLKNAIYQQIIEFPDSLM